jgi:hypothetical protein
MKITIDFPDRYLTKLTEHDIKMILGVSLYEKVVLGSNECAGAVGVDYSDFIMEMGKYGESIFDLSEEEIIETLKMQDDSSLCNVIISDTSYIANHSNIEQLDLLKKLYGHVTITPEAFEEFTEKNNEILPDWIGIKESKQE